MISSTMDEVYKSRSKASCSQRLYLSLPEGIKSTLIIARSMPICIMITLMVMAIAESQSTA